MHTKLWLHDGRKRPVGRRRRCVDNIKIYLENITDLCIQLVRDSISYEHGNVP